MVADSGSGLPPDAHSVCTEVRVAPSKRPRDDKVMDSTKTVRTHGGRLYATFLSNSDDMTLSCNVPLTSTWCYSDAMCQCTNGHTDRPSTTHTAATSRAPGLHPD